jgi:hypothetical protein
VGRAASLKTIAKLKLEVKAMRRRAAQLILESAEVERDIADLQALNGSLVEPKKKARNR